MSMVEEKPEDDLRDSKMLLTRLVELETIITNALGIMAETGEVRPYKKISPKPMNVENMAAKAKVGSIQEVKKSREHKLLPNNEMFFKSNEEDRGEPRMESPDMPEDSQDKDLAAALETALEKLRRAKHTLRVSEEAAFVPSDEA